MLINDFRKNMRTSARHVYDVDTLVYCYNSHSDSSSSNRNVIMISGTVKTRVRAHPAVDFFFASLSQGLS